MKKVCKTVLELIGCTGIALVAKCVKKMLHRLHNLSLFVKKVLWRTMKICKIKAKIYAKSQGWLLFLILISISCK